MLVLTKKMLLLLPVLVYLIGANILRMSLVNPHVSQQQLYIGQLLLFGLVFLGFILVRPLMKKVTLPWQLGVGLFLVLPLLIPSVMQTDQYRYIWDGINSARGVNPYSQIPIQSREFQTIWWIGLINFPSLPTIYPPAAQQFFLIGGILNPFFYRDGMIDPAAALTLFQVEFGWALIIGGAAAIGVLAHRRYRWEELLINPLVIICGLGNKHLDLILIPLIGILLSQKLWRQRPWRHLFLTAVAIGTKWFPLLMVPFFLIKQTPRLMVVYLGGLGLLLGLVMSLFLPDIFQALAHSSSSFAKDWYFFGFGYEWLRLVFLEVTSFPAAKLCAALLGGMWFIYLLTLHKSARCQPASLRLKLTWLFIAYFALIPMVYPWYLLTLLAIGYRHRRVLWTPWFWPASSFISQSYYIDNRFPPLLQEIYYLLITTIIIRDLVVCRHYLFTASLRTQTRRQLSVMQSTTQV